MKCQYTESDMISLAVFLKNLHDKNYPSDPIKWCSVREMARSLLKEGLVLGMSNLQKIR